MITYDTNFMGPLKQDWYRERGLTEVAEVKVESKILAEIRGVEVGDIITRETVTEYWAGGRIDIYGLDSTEYYNGRSEYGLPIMDGTSFNKFTEWLDTLKTETLWSFDELIEGYQQTTTDKIRWAHEVFAHIQK